MAHPKRTRKTRRGRRSWLIEIKATNTDKGVEVSYKSQGKGADIMAETYTAIQSLMFNLRKASKDMHHDMLGILAENHSWMAVRDDEGMNDSNDSIDITDLLQTLGRKAIEKGGLS